MIWLTSSWEQRKNRQSVLTRREKYIYLYMYIYIEGRAEKKASQVNIGAPRRIVRVHEEHLSPPHLQPSSQPRLLLLTPQLKERNKERWGGGGKKMSWGLRFGCIRARMRRSYDSMDGVQHWRYSEYHMEEKQVGERQQNDLNAIMFREDARFRNQRAVGWSGGAFSQADEEEKVGCALAHSLWSMIEMSSCLHSCNWCIWMKGAHHPSAPMQSSELYIHFHQFGSSW